VPHDVAIGLMKRALTLIETQVPEMAEAYMRVPFDYYGNLEFAAKEKTLFETSPLALVAATEVGQPHDYVVRSAVGRSILVTRDEDGVAHFFLNYCRHRGAEPAKGCGNSRRLSCHTMPGITIRKAGWSACRCASVIRRWRRHGVTGTYGGTRCPWRAPGSAGLGRLRPWPDARRT
jgi:hypothetical protein